MKTKFLIFITLCFIFNNITNAFSKEITHLYTVSISKDLSTLYVKIHFGDIAFYTLYAGSRSTAKFTKNMYFASNKSMIYTPQGDEIKLKQNAASQTLYYEFDISASLGKRRWDDAQKAGNDVLIPPDLWMWRPYRLKDNEHIEIQFDFPDDINFSIPGIPVGKNRYRLLSTPYDWPSAGVFGPFKKDTVSVGECLFSVAFLDGNYKTTPAELSQWIREAAQSVCNIYGDFPVKNVQILIIPVGQRGEPVPFGMVVRGYGISVNFYVDSSRPLKEFIADWTATHELSHCLLPLIDRDDAWLSEGMATYYQYILMGRDGRLSEQETWQRIYDGFQKGLKGTRGISLKLTSENMHEYRAFRYVYWSGAAMLLKADVALRLESKDKKSLDQVLKEVQKNCLNENRSWAGLEMMQLFDRFAGTSVFMDIYNNNILSKDFPVDDSYWAKLGVIVRNGVVALNNQAPYADIRKSILKPDH